MSRPPVHWAILVAITALACGGRNAPSSPALAASGPELPPPPPIGASVRGASYLTAVAGHIQPAWGQFLEDCRLRLPKTHPLNQPGLVATAELAISRTGKADTRIVTGSGNGDFDTAVFDVLGDVTPLPSPPFELVSDDDQVHIRWVFARDSRQAGPATAQIVDVQLPLLGVVERLLDKGALARAAQRIAVSPVSDPDRMTATERLMIATLRDSLRNSNGAVRRAAVEAIGRANVQPLAAEVHALVVPVADVDLRIVAIAAAAALRDPAVVAALVTDLRDDLEHRPRVALAKIEALVALGRAGEAQGPIRATLTAPSGTGLAALALVPDAELAPKLGTWFASSDARARAAVCMALPVAAPELAPKLIAKGLRDPDATVRATCTEASVRGVDWSGRERRAKLDPQIVKRLRELARDRDRTVRARAIAALGFAEPAHRLRAVDDPAAEVRAASVVGASEAELRILAVDREPEVRAAAIAALGDRGPELATKAISDLAAPVRRAAVMVLAADDALEKLAADDSPDVATAALVKLTAKRGRSAMTSPLVSGLAVTANGPERVRIALAWLLAR